MMTLGCVFVASLSCAHWEIQRRPYHSNCRCALHKLKGDVGEAAACALHKKNVSFSSKKRPWNQGCLHVNVNVNASHEDFSSQSSSSSSSFLSIGNVEDSNESLTSNG